jgi:adenine-specific DNA methylase
MRFIEKTLPIEHLNPVAMAEGNAKKPVYRMHKWWARRLGSVFRMITLATFIDHDESDVSLWQRFCNGADLQGKIVLDPFMGGGTTIVEALRLGCKVIGLDINPVAWFLTKKEVESVTLDALDEAFEHLAEGVGQFIRRYYRTRCPHGHPADVIYFFWVKVAQCAECGTKVRLFPNYELSRREDINVCFCPYCLQVIKTVGYDPETKCPECGEIFDPRDGVSGRGLFRCPECGARQRILDAIKRKGSKLDEELHALEGHCDICGRFFKRIDDFDVALWKEAKEEFNRRKAELLIPDQAIPTEGRSDPRPVNHGYRYFWQMFNERQLLCLSRLLEEILKLPDQNVREFMLVAFSDCLDTNTMFCKYEIQWHKISVFFGLHAYHPIERPTENNVWGTKYGRGTFIRCFEKVRRAKEYCQKPYERLLDIRGRRFSKRTGKERIEGYNVETFEELLRRDHAALLRCASSEDLSFIPDRSVDAVITDPPYFESVQYSELADFFYVWLRLALKDRYPWFIPELSSRPNEIVQNEKLGKSVEFFSRGLQRVFKECHRVLKDDGVMVFTFHHNKTWAWETIAHVLLESGFYISASPIVRSEGKSGFHSSEGNIRYDAALVCRKQPSDWSESRWSEMKQQILDEAVDWTRRTLESGMAINRVDVFTIVMAKSIEYITKAWANPNGHSNPAKIIDLLREMKEIVDEVTLYSRAELESQRKAYSREVEQLVLFLRESETRYGKGV